MKIKITENQRILLLIESKVDDLITKYCDQLKKNDIPCDDELKSILIHIDPTPTKKYLEWIIKKIVLMDPEMIFHAADQVLDNMKRFDDLSNKNQLENKDINSYDEYIDLQLAVINAEEKKSKKDLSGQYKKLYEDDQYLMVQPLTEEASCKFGVDTKWCISSRLSNRWKQYTEENKNEFFFIIKKGVGRGVHNRLAIQLTDFGRLTVWNAQDHVEDPKILKTLPSGINDVINKRLIELSQTDLSCYERFKHIDTFAFGGELGDFDRSYFNNELKGIEEVVAIYYQDHASNEEFYFITVSNPGRIDDNNRIKYELNYRFNGKTNRILHTTSYCGGDSAESAVDFVKYVNEQYLNIKHYVLRLKGEYLERVGYTYWYPTNFASTYTFEDPSRAGNTTKSFIEYVKKQNEEGKPATKNGFLEYIGREPRKGYLSIFFASIKDAGIVKLQGKNYTLGPNYEKYLQGKLRMKRKFN